MQYIYYDNISKTYSDSILHLTEAMKQHGNTGTIYQHDVITAFTEYTDATSFIEACTMKDNAVYIIVNLNGLYYVLNAVRKPLP